MYRFIQSQSQHYPVQVLCQTLGVNRSGYYDWRKPKTISPAKGTDDQPVKPDRAQQIKDIFSLHRRRYGSRRLVSEMRDRGSNVSGPPLRSGLCS